MSIYLWQRVSKTNCIKYKLPCSDMEETVRSLKERFLKCFENTKYPLELIHHGQILPETQTLAESGIEPNVVVYIYIKPPPSPKEVSTESFVSEEKISQVHKFIVSVRSHPHNKMASMLKMNRPENVKKILQKIPKLQEDQRAMALLLDPFLLTMIKEEATLRKIAQCHPALIEALIFIMEMLKENEKPVKNQRPGTSSSLPSMSSLLAESDSESSGSDNFNLAGTSSRRSNSESNSRITSNQLSAALAFANNASISSASNAVPTTSSNGSSLNRSNSSSIITSSMFSNALTHAMRQVRNTQGSRSSNQGSQNENSALATQLHRMQEMGLTDDAINVQALVICNGDVQAAINLVLSGAIGNDD